MRHLAFALTALLALTAVGRAEPFGFTYSFAINDGPAILSTYGTGPVYLAYNGGGNSFTLDHGSGVVTLTLAGGGDAVAMPTYSGWPSADVPFGTFSVAPGSLPVDFAFNAVVFGTATITDLPSGETGTLNLILSLDGWTGPGGTGYAMRGGTAEYPLMLGGNGYIVNVDPGEIDPTGSPLLMANVHIETMPEPETLPPWEEDGGEYGSTDSPPVVDAPEPSSLMLLGLGGLGLIGWRHRRRPS